MEKGTMEMSACEYCGKVANHRVEKDVWNNKANTQTTMMVCHACNEKRFYIAGTNFVGGKQYYVFETK